MRRVAHSSCSPREFEVRIQSSARHPSVHIIYKVQAHAHPTHKDTPTHTQSDTSTHTYQICKYINDVCACVLYAPCTHGLAYSIPCAHAAIDHACPQLVSYTWYFSIVRGTFNNFISRWNTHRLCAARARALSARSIACTSRRMRSGAQPVCGKMRFQPAVLSLVVVASA